MKDVKYGVSNATAFCKDITALPHETLEALDCGDFVVERTESGARAFRVSKKVPFSSAEITYADSSKVVSISYEYDSEAKVWEYKETNETELGGGGIIIEQIGNPAQLTIDEEEIAKVSFTLTQEQKAKAKSSKAIIFTMNNSFIMTPLAQQGETLACQSFAYDESGNTMVARVRFVWGANNSLVAYFDLSFSSRVVESGITPYAILLTLN